MGIKNDFRKLCAQRVTRKCVDCGKEFSARRHSKNQVRCTECQAAHRRDANRKRKERIKAESEADPVNALMNLSGRLEVFNRWRRGCADVIEMPDPKKLGEDIDMASEIVKRVSDTVKHIRTRTRELSFEIGSDDAVSELRVVIEKLTK